MGQAFGSAPYFFKEKHMITEISYKKMPGGERLCEFRGLSTDDPKPTEGVCNGSSFFEIDTGDTYYYDATAETGGWTKPGGES